jgi:chorismate mutase
MNGMTRAEAERLLAECRTQIDAIDLELRALLNRRSEIVIDVLRAKNVLEMPIYEANREELVLKRVTEGNPGPLNDESLRRLFGTLMEEMRVFQDMLRQRDVHAKQSRGGAAEPAE